MKTAVNVLGSKLQALMGNMNFRSDFDQVLDSPEHLLAIGEDNLREYQKIEVLDEEVQERILNIISNMLASVLQEEAIKHCGNTEGESIRRVLYDWHNQPENRAYCDKLMRCAKQSLVGLNLTQAQLQGVCELLDEVPLIMIENLEELTRPISLLPRSEAQSIATALADMLKEDVT